MGHQRLGVLPATRKWQAIITLLVSGADGATIAQATAQAAEKDLVAASADPVLRHAYWLLTQIPLAARQADFVGCLRELGLSVSSSPNLIEICAALSLAIDRSAAAIDDFSEIASVTATESLCAIAGSEGPTLFGSSFLADEAHASLHRLATPKNFGVLATHFFGRLVQRFLDYYLSRELPNHIGSNHRFPSLRDHQIFEQAIEAHCRETARIVQDFAAEWFSKHTFQGGIGRTEAGAFVHVAIKKLVDELTVRRPMNA